MPSPIDKFFYETLIFTHKLTLKKWRIQNRSPKNSHVCLPLNVVIYLSIFWRKVLWCSSRGPCTSWCSICAAVSVHLAFATSTAPAILQEVKRLQYGILIVTLQNFFSLLAFKSDTKKFPVLPMVHGKKRLTVFLSPAGMSLTKVWKMSTLFLQCTRTAERDIGQLWKSLRHYILFQYCLEKTCSHNMATTF